MGVRVRNVLVWVVTLVSIQAFAEPARQAWRLSGAASSGGNKESPAVAAKRVLEAFKPALEGVSRIGFVAETPVNTRLPGSVEARLYFTQMVLAPTLVVALPAKEASGDQPDWVLISLSPGYEEALPGLLARHGLVVHQAVSSRRVLAKRVKR